MSKATASPTPPQRPPSAPPRLQDGSGRSTRKTTGALNRTSLGRWWRMYRPQQVKLPGSCRVKHILGIDVGVSKGSQTLCTCRMPADIFGMTSVLPELQSAEGACFTRCLLEWLDDKPRIRCETLRLPARGAAAKRRTPEDGGMEDTYHLDLSLIKMHS